MSGDKRTVSTDALETLGTIIGPDEKRDAIHLAVYPVEAGMPLAANADVGLDADGKAYEPFFRKQVVAVGKVDPFLQTAVKAGERFWLVIYPRQIKSLRHVWEHPAFPPSGEVEASPATKEASEAWLREFCARSDCPPYEIVIAAASGQPAPQAKGYEQYYPPGEAKAWELQDFGDGERCLHFLGRDAHDEIPPEFWHHVEVVTGIKIPDDKRANSFSCSC